MARLFIGVPAPASPALRALAGELAVDPRLKVVDPALYHVTLAFLGDAAERSRPAIREAIEAASVGIPLHMGALRGLGAFPDPGRARVLWTRAEGTRLDELAARTRAALKQRQIAFDDKPFHLHVTLARTRDACDLRPIIAKREAEGFGALPVERVALFSSTLTPHGPRYEMVAAVGLREAA